MRPVTDFVMVFSKAPRLLGAAALVGVLAGCHSHAASSTTEVLPPQGTAFDAVVTEPVETPLEKKFETERDLERVAPPSAIPAPAKESEGKDKDGAKEISFRELAGYEYETVDPLSMLQKGGPPPQTEIPADIQALSGMRVKVDGYLMPTIFESGKVEKFLLTRSYITCCFGDVLNMNEVIDVNVGDDLEVSYFLSGQPVTVTGWIEVGEKKSEFGYVESVYRMIAEEVIERW